MGTFAEATASRYGFSREAQDAFAFRSLTRAKKAIEAGIFDEEVVSVTIQGRKGDTLVETDETPLKANLEKIPTLKPAFAKEWNGNTSQFLLDLRWCGCACDDA
jgi:acetyl-CoA C-acetyltransferase